MSDKSLEPLLNTYVGLAVLQGYAITDQDNSSPAYYGYVNKNGNFYIMKATTTGPVVQYRYYYGSSGYAAAWTGKAGLSYDYFYTIF